MKKSKDSIVKAHTEQTKKQQKKGDKVDQLKYEVGQEFGINNNTNNIKP